VRRGRPSDARGNRLLFAGEPRALVGHLEEKQEGELLEVVLVGEAVVAEDVAVGPEFLDDPVGGVAHKASGCTERFQIARLGPRDADAVEGGVDFVNRNHGRRHNLDTERRTVLIVIDQDVIAQAFRALTR
jgi:hypothetical protein